MCLLRNVVVKLFQKRTQQLGGNLVGGLSHHTVHKISEFKHFKMTDDTSTLFPHKEVHLIYLSNFIIPRWPPDPTHTILSSLKTPASYEDCGDHIFLLCADVNRKGVDKLQTSLRIAEPAL